MPRRKPCDAVKRWRIYYDEINHYKIRECSEGEYIEYPAYRKLEAENKRLKATLRVFDKHDEAFKELASDELGGVNAEIYKLNNKLKKAMCVIKIAKAVYDNDDFVTDCVTPEQWNAKVSRDVKLGKALEDFYKGENK